MIKTISILGCGWLGLPLGKSLVDKGFIVKGSTTSPKKVSIIKEAGIIPHLLKINDRVESSTLKSFFQSDLLILNIPPGGRKDPEVEHSYPQKINAVLNEVHPSTIKHLIFISTTAVYNSRDHIVNEESTTDPSTPSGKAVLIAERLLGLQKGIDISILRMAGLVGGDRKAGRFLAGKKGVPNGSAPINLVHLDDCIGVIETIIQQAAWNEIFNICADLHPSRVDFYTHQAIKEGLEPPTFLNNPQKKGKIVSNEKVKSALGYQFIHPDPYHFP
ncbi:MAG: SDR family oxidoreductase [Chitinophagales bacterium]|nr:SDR family oxidoreductase [Chitinophagales bacterium]